jgi:uncharacterized membrane protein YjjP (DUF1212 family)
MRKVMDSPTIDNRALQKKEMEATYLSLELGRLLLVNGADTCEAEQVVSTFAASLGFDASLLITYEAILATVEFKGATDTRIGRHLIPPNVDMNAIASLKRLANEVLEERLSFSSAHEAFERLEQSQHLYPTQIVVATLGVSAGSIARLFGADWTVVCAATLAAILGSIVRLRLGRAKVNPFANSFWSALVGALVGGLAIRLAPNSTQWLSLVAPGMILVPGVPMMNAIREVIGNHLSVGCSRLMFVAVTLLSIGLGIFIAATVIGIGIPLMGATPSIPVWQDIIFSALTTTGFITLFNVRPRIAWAPLLCGTLGHPVRTILMHYSVKLVFATFLASLLIGVAAHYLTTVFKAPPTTIGFPAMVTMIPGSFAFRAFMGAAQIIQVSNERAPSIVASTSSLALTTVFLAVAIAIGLAIPMAFPSGRKKQHHRTYSSNCSIRVLEGRE